MSDKIFTLYKHDDARTDEGKILARRAAVEAALELIHADRLGGGAASTNLGGHMAKLSEYADQIEAALKPKQ